MKRILLFINFLLFNSSCCLIARIPLDPADNYRYHTLKLIMKRYQRPISFMHLWPNRSQVGIALAEKYNCVSIIPFKRTMQSDIESGIEIVG